MAKIGLLAPFEGLYRHSGYEALEAMRAAIVETDSGGIAILPLALDTGANPSLARHATAKMLIDPTVEAVVGPLTPAVAGAVAPQIADRSLPWYLPFVHPDRPTAPLSDPAWLAPLAEAAAAHADENGRSSLVLAGWPDAWSTLEAEAWMPSAGEWSIRLATEPADIRAEDTVLWLGDAASGADYLARLRARHPAVPFWLATAGGGRVFYRHALDKRQRLNMDAAFGPIFTVAWLDDGYEQWADTHAPDSPTAYAVYRATEAAIAAITGAEVPERGWKITVLQLTGDGDWKRIE